MKRIILLGKGEASYNLRAILMRVVCDVTIVPVTTLEELKATPLTPDAWLVSHSTSVIVPAEILEALQGRAVNIHAASPTYPGRDPHHFAIYDGAKRYGATAHLMTPTVDDGVILDVEWFDVADDETPVSLLTKANVASLRVAERIVPKLLAGNATPCGDQWGERKTSRSDFKALCEVTPDMPLAEIERRRRAVTMPGRSNLFVSLSGIYFSHPGPE